MREVVLVLFVAAVLVLGGCSPDRNGALPLVDRGTVRDSGVLFDASSAANGGTTSEDASSPAKDGAIAALTVTSPAFAGGASIPKVHSCDGAGESIPLAWSGAPKETRSYAVVMRDLSLPDANNYHWVLWDIPATTTSLPQGIAKMAEPPVPAGAKQAVWSFGAELGYGPMCPPSGTHEYELSVYAFAMPTLPLANAPTSPNQVDALLQVHKTAAGSIVGTYTR